MQYGFFKRLAAVFLSLAMIGAPFFGELLRGGKSAFFDKWSESQPFTADYAVRLNKNPEKDFVILNLTDIQLDTAETFGRIGTQVKATIDQLIREVKPDLITLTGDNAWRMLAYNDLVQTLEGYGIPWAPVMGNHDGQGCPNEFWCAYQLYKAKNCLFRFGPADMGYGNYIIHIYEQDRIVQTLFMMDTHDSIEEDNCNGKKGEGYDHLWENQMRWYEWAVKGTNTFAGANVESTVFFHIPLREYADAWNEATENGQYKAEYADSCFGTQHEWVCCPPENNGFFALMQRLDSTKNVVCGHDHVNCDSILYQGIRLTYGLKCGEGAYWEPEMSGGTSLTIASDGQVTVAHHFVDTASMAY